MDWITSNSKFLIQKPRQGIAEEERAALEVRAEGQSLVQASIADIRRGRIAPEIDWIPFGSRRFIEAVAAHQGLALPAPIDYPASLRLFLGRSARLSSLQAARGLAESNRGPFFLKPAAASKRFRGTVVRSRDDMYLFDAVSGHLPVWIVEHMPFSDENRVFVIRGKIAGICKAPCERSESAIDHPTIECAVKAYESSGQSPAAYALDFGLTVEGRTRLIEANDAFYLGRYGLPAATYVDLVSTRWRQFVGLPAALV